MLRKEVTIINKLGLHARAASKFVTLASGFQSDIRLARGNREVNGKSILGVMMLAAGRGTALEIIAEGADEERAVHALEELIGIRFGEEE
ncbi:MAG: HPr family phosphocarrier protein [Gammaproteobacteria bacterium]|nr:HPr family phosphocarrier protein [Gammaproteobacteria bacterium]